MTATDVIDRAEAWDAIAGIEGQSVASDDPGMAALPAPARRLLDHAIPDGKVAVLPMVLDLEGEIKLKRWLPFTARQILHPTEGFVWNATVGRRLLRFQGGDTYWQGRGSLEFKLLGLLSLVRASGPDIDRSAAGRLAVEAVAWTPQALLPAAGAVWRPIDQTHATVTRQINGEPLEVTVTVNHDGVLQELQMMRWGNPDGDEFGLRPFGGSVSQVGIFNGITIAIAGNVGWWWGTDRQAEGEFFRYRIHSMGPASTTIG